MDLKATNLTEANLSNVKIDALRDFYKKLSGEEKVNAQWSKAKLAQEIELLKAAAGLTDAPTAKGDNAPTAETEKLVEESDNEEEVPPPAKFYGNIRKDVEILSEDRNCVVFFLTDKGALKEGILDADEPEPDVKGVKRMSPENFWRLFASEYLNNDKFINVTDAKTIVRIFQNLKPEHVAKAMRNELIAQKSEKNRDKVMDIAIKKFKNLRLNGSNQFIKRGDIVHCPGITEEELATFPNQVMRESKYGDLLD